MKSRYAKYKATYQSTALPMNLVETQYLFNKALKILQIFAVFTATT